MKIRVAIADDHPLSIAGLHHILTGSDGICVCATWVNRDALLDGIAKEAPDVLLLGMCTGICPEQDVLTSISKTCPALNIVVLSYFDQALFMDIALRNGARGYLLRNTDRNTLIHAIETVYQGDIFLNADHLLRVQQYRYLLRHKYSGKYLLTVREKNILRLILEGLNSQEIADTLYLSSRTVENYRLNLSIKLEAKNTASLVRKTIELNLLGA